MTKIKTVRERTSTPSQLAGIVAVVVPPLGLVAAVWLLWNRGMHPVDLVLLAGFYAACGLGITVGFHRLFTHRSFETSAPIRAVWAILGSMAMQGRSPSGSPTTASTMRSPTGRAIRTPPTPGTATRGPSTCSVCGTRTSAGSSRRNASSGVEYGRTCTRTGRAGDRSSLPALGRADARASVPRRKRCCLFYKQTAPRGYETGTSACARAGKRRHAGHGMRTRFAGQT